MKSLVLGGIKSGKSSFAESIAAESGRNVIVIATATANDAEMEERIRRHKASRSAHWQVIEEPIALGSTLRNLNHTGDRSSAEPAQDCIIIDCLTLWLTNLLLLDDTQAFEQEKEGFIKAIHDFEQQIVIVSNETNMGIVPLGELSRRFCDETGLIHQRLSQHVDHVVLMIAGLSHTIKGQATLSY
jgi:adenosylcobinamide kinase/adenosylcobinamide-phosphate guanylyltransferase